MLLNGSNIAHRNATESQATLTISQLIVFNSKKKSSTTSGNQHSLEREPPLPLYVGLSIRAYTRSKKIINELFQLGISVSYDRVDDLLNGLGTAVCNRFQQDGVVCPLNLNCGLFTVGALDNIDYNPSATTSQGSFHGTGISLFQFPSSSVDGTQSRPPITLPPGKPDRNIHLPESYTTVPAVSVKTTELTLSKTAYTEAFFRNLQQAMAQEDCWAQHALLTVDKEVRNEFVVTSRGSSDMQRCNHEEADTRIALHVQHALDKGCKQVFVRTVDTDVLIILIGLFHDMITLCPSAAIWIGLGMGKTQHALRAVYQSSIWYKSLQSVQMVPSPEGWGWCEMDGTWKPVWMTLPEAAKACLELLICGCKQGCTEISACDRHVTTLLVLLDLCETNNSSQ
ncbi:hypothetical protein P5673_029513 [Acropora cervicornis]|uniref:Uncharacterized protein n=1 Tax=Acropora cervicornis TaxID=6130 RepID=A0AAD9PVL6_ACRCE|nr:hypothetical protein P5673_029513 [Acropora cervicornis]